MRWPSPEDELRDATSNWNEDLTQSMSFPPTAFADLPPRAPSPVRLNSLSPSPSASQRSRSPTPPIPSTSIGPPLLQEIYPNTWVENRRIDLPVGGNITREKPRGQRRRLCSLGNLRRPHLATHPNTRIRSPPPMPRRPSIAPPVPPLPEFVRAKQALLHPRKAADDAIPLTVNISRPVLSHSYHLPTAGDIACTVYTACTSFLMLHNSHISCKGHPGGPTAYDIQHQ